MIVAGIMSGTSLDGIDAAIVETRGRAFQVRAFRTAPYPKALRARILAVSNSDTHTARIAELNFDLARAYAAAVQRLWPGPIDLAGCHGQTVYHSPGCTLQLGDGSVLAEALGAPVVSNFRPGDMAAGGQGAPLVPFFDYRVLASRGVGRVALNIGGIANITVLPAGAGLDEVAAFDTGPGNMVIDQLTERYTKGRQRFDRGGRIAARGTLDRKLLTSLLSEPYYRRRPPKSAGREQYGAAFADRFPASPSGIHTATALTAATIADAVRRFAHGTAELVASGGGTHNPVLMGCLAALLPDVRIRGIEEFGVSADAKEAVAFALLAVETWHRRPGNVPAATGARRAVVLGQISWGG
jgi:anhydro-N-acetylmuramic acid kinase